MRKVLARAIYFPTLSYNVLLGRGLKWRRWWDAVDDHLILGAVPFRRDVKKLRELGVTGVVNMCEEYAGPIAEYQSLGIEQLWLPTTDFHHPLADHVDAGAEFIEKHAQCQGITYVHCKAGRARSATIVLWWLVRFRGLSPIDAQRKILIARPHANPRIYERPVIAELMNRERLASLGKTATTEA